MELNSIIFPAPASSYGVNGLKELLWIPRTFKHEEHKIITKNFKALTVKASILDEKEAKALSTNREIIIVRKFDNVKVQASIYKRESISEEETLEEKPPMMIVKDFENWSLKASIIDKKDSDSQRNELNTRKESSEKIPCLWVKYQGSRKLILYFHGNAEDIGISTEFVNMISKNLKV